MNDKVLILNCGSSSIKFAVIDPKDGACAVSGLVERMDNAQLTLKVGDNKEILALHTHNFATGLKKTLSIIQSHPAAIGVTAVGHRVVHGGEQFKASVVITDAVSQVIEQCIPLAPLHNPVNLEGIHLAMEAYSHLKHVACFDTAFHQSMPASAYHYAVPYEWYENYGVRKYGFHGTSHQFVSQVAIRRYNLDPNDSGIVTLHLGNGCSLCAVQNGCSVDTTMGMTPLDGVVMGTRSGSIDPGIIEYIHQCTGLTVGIITEQLNKKSGLLGVSGVSNDMRDLHRSASMGHYRAQLALDVFTQAVAKQVAAMAMQLQRLDCLIFTGGIGENDVAVRHAIVKKLGVLQLQLNPSLNDNGGRLSEGKISDSTPIISVIPTNEEWQIARETQRCLTV